MPLIQSDCFINSIVTLLVRLSPDKGSHDNQGLVETSLLLMGCCQPVPAVDTATFTDHIIFIAAIACTSARHAMSKTHL